MAIRTRSMSVIDSMTMSAPTPEESWWCFKPTNRLGRKEPNDDHYRSRFPPRVSANSFGGYRQRRVPGKAARASRRRGEVLPRCGGCGPEGGCGHGGQRARALVRTIAGRVTD